ncbi:MAG: c-type cytochrome [Candidatus Latescibacterota bacterium]|nr:MAG: c-type cytochrome [Candidatus Latescibacterota bacterium]
MNYPFWDVGVGYGILMAVIAVLHVFVSHFAIGGGLYLVVAETAARRSNDTLRIESLQKLTKFFVLLTLVFGALSGVGIWVIIGLLNPAATEVLIHNFVWGWATEWTFFVVEICAAIIYFYGWKTMSARNHQIVGWIYFWAAWLSLVVINGIICFMLTPGKWLETGSFWNGFFNPTYWPSLVFRTGICLLLAGIFSLAVASRFEAGEFKARLVRYNARWSILGVAVIVPSWFWYWKAIPSRVTTTAAEMMPTPMSSIDVAFWFLAVLAVFLVVFGLLIPRKLHTVVAIVMLAMGLGFFGGFEWMRESIRKPYVIYDYMYGNAVELAKADTYRSDGYLSEIAFRTGNDGADLFRRACRSCHTIDGYKPLGPAFDGTDPDFIAGIVKGTHVLKGNMPEFLGTEEEAALIADHIWARVDQRDMSEIYGLTGVDLGKKVFDVRCGRCHEIGGYNDKTESLAGLAGDEYEDILDNASDYGDEMPDFTGDDVERMALIAYLKTLEEGGEQQ